MLIFEIIFLNEEEGKQKRAQDSSYNLQSGKPQSGTNRIITFSLTI